MMTMIMAHICLVIFDGAYALRNGIVLIQRNYNTVLLLCIFLEPIKTYLMVPKSTGMVVKYLITFHFTTTLTGYRL